jgi:hypothetical protein
VSARFEDRNTPTEPTEYFDVHGIERVRGQLRSSIIVDPPDGLIPGNDLYKQQVVRARTGVLSAMDGPEQRPAAERCLASQTTQPPILAIRNGVNLHQIVQTADSFVFVSEFVGAARIIRLNSQRSAAAVTSWLGDSIGHWEGETLVVETTNLNPGQKAHYGIKQRFYLPPTGKVIERFTRVSAKEILYQFTVEDRTAYTRPWKGEVPLLATNDQIYEYACHEGNYALPGILAGAREAEKAAARPK